MSFFSKLFGSKSPAVDPLVLAALGTDMHSHLLPGLDDGAETVEHSVELLRQLQALGLPQADYDAPRHGRLLPQHARGHPGGAGGTS